MQVIKFALSVMSQIAARFPSQWAQEQFLCLVDIITRSSAINRQLEMQYFHLMKVRQSSRKCGKSIARVALDSVSVALSWQSDDLHFSINNARDIFSSFLARNVALLDRNFPQHLLTHRLRRTSRC